MNSKELLLNAKKKKYAIPATNFIDLDSARTFVNVAEKRKLPLILPFAQSHRDIISLEEAALIGKYLANSVSVPVVLHLDHGEDLDYISKAIKLGFTSVMIDASQKSFEKNVEITKRVVEIAHENNVTVEAELGHVGANDTSESNEITNSIYTEVSDVISFVEQTNVDSLAVSIGTAHGIYKGTPKLNFDRLKEINNIVDIPLVLHGGSSTGFKNLTRCATSGISKINIYSDFLKAAIESVNDNSFNDYIQLKNRINDEMAKVLNNYFDVFKTDNYLL